jgi:hypothetical protein
VAQQTIRLLDVEIALDVERDAPPESPRPPSDADRSARR